MKALMNTLRWILSFSMAAVFFVKGMSKFMDSALWHAQFMLWGYPGWLAQVAGLVEMGGAMALLVPSMTAMAAMLLAMERLAALLTHLRAEEYELATMSMALLAILAGLISMLREDIRRMFGGGGFQHPLPHH